jgi:hypothetical protein
MPRKRAYQWPASLLFNDLRNMIIDLFKITLKLCDKQVKLTNVNRSTLCDDGHENVLADLDFLDKVLVIHHGYLEVAARTQFGELVLEVLVQDVDSTSEACQEILIDLSFQLKVSVQPAVDFPIVLHQFGQHDCF